MKSSIKIVLAILVLSIAIWLFFFVVLKDKLTPDDAMVVVGVSAAVVFSVKGILGLLGRRRKEN